MEQNSHPIAVVEDYYPDDDVAYLGTFMYPPGYDEKNPKGSPVLIVATITEIDELSKEAYNIFIEESRAAASHWSATFTNEGWTWDDLVKGWCKDEVGGE